jgi:hypothetical protein
MFVHSVLHGLWNVPLSLEFLDPFHGPDLEFCRIARDGGFARAFHPRDAAIERRDQFEQLANGLSRRYRHGGLACELVTERVPFQISPHVMQRQ